MSVPITRAQRVSALGAVRDDVLAYASTLTDADWAQPSHAAGWSVGDVVAHLAATSRTVFSPAAVNTMLTADIEELNNREVTNRRHLPRATVIAEYAAWSTRLIGLADAVGRTFLARAPLRIGDVGTFPLRLLPATLTFDWHTHLAHDIAPAVGRPAPTPDAHRVAVAVEWMLAVLEQSGARAHEPLRLTLTGPGGGSWDIAPRASGQVRVVRAARDVAPHSEIVGPAVDFPAWATTRTPWREAQLTIRGDDTLVADFLDTVDII